MKSGQIGMLVKDDGYSLRLKHVFQGWPKVTLTQSDPIQSAAIVVASRARLRWSAHGLISLCVLILASCVGLQSDRDEWRSTRNGSQGLTTFDKYLHLALAGDAKSQNLLGFMKFFGEGTEMNRAEARMWFDLAADQDYPPATRNLAIMRELGIGLSHDRRGTALPAQSSAFDDWGKPKRKMFAEDNEREMIPGERTYVTFCAGCHGLNGIAAYVESPSFALGERMDKPDQVLLQTIKGGTQEMPGWDGKLSEQQLKDVLFFVRRLESQYEAGVGQILRAAPDRFYLFEPMSESN